MVHTSLLKQLLLKQLVRPVTGLTLLALITSVPAKPVTAQSSSGTVTPRPPAATVFPATDNSDYILGPGDRIRIEMFDQPDLFRTEYTVLVDGTISLPFIGRVPVNGLSIKDAAAEIGNRYVRYFKRPLVSVTLVAPRPINIAISGEVRRPGSYPVAASGELPTLTQAIRLAGGTTQSADLRSVQIRRARSAGPQQVIAVDLQRLLMNGDLRQDLPLRDGDSVFIPTATNFDLNTSLLLADASFSVDEAETLNVAVVGEVFRPGPYTISPGNAVVNDAGQVGDTRNAGNTRNRSNKPTVTQAIQVAGGIKPEADIRKVQVRRITRVGSEQLIEIDLWKLLQEGDLKQDITLQQGDTIIVPTATALNPAEATKVAAASFSPATIDINVVGEVRRPGIAQLPPNSPLNTALLAAGGFDTRRAKRSSVTLIRLNPDGTVSEREVKVDFSQGINEEGNPALRNNDVIVVGRSGLASFSDTLTNILSPVSSVFGIPRLFNVFLGN